MSKDPKGIVIKFPVTQSRPSRNGNDFRAGGGDHHHLPCGIGLIMLEILRVISSPSTLWGLFTYGEKSRAGLIAQPALSAKLR